MLRLFTPIQHKFRKKYHSVILFIRGLNLTMSGIEGISDERAFQILPAADTADVVRASSR